MAASQPFGISCKGGLNTNLNQLEMLGQPGFATELLNFEVDPDGGYRRINGYTSLGTARPNGGEKLLGLAVYADGLVACSGTDIFFTTDGATWLQINKTGVHGSGDNYTTFTGRSVLTRTNQKKCSITIFEGNEAYGQLLICDGENKPLLFKISGTGALTTRTFFVEEVTVNGTVSPSVGVIHDKHFVVAGAPTQKNTIYYSHTLEPDNFTGAGAGSVSIDDQVVGLKSFRTDLFIFCKNSIYKLININDSQNIAVVPIAKNVGCLSHYSIQEIGGDLVFLSPDGVRTVAGTARIGDVELGSVSRQIQAITSLISRDIDDYNISSCVLRRRSQYRLYYSTAAEQSTESRGIIGTLTRNGFEWSETRGIKAYALTSDFDNVGVEKKYHGDDAGYIFYHDKGKYFHQLNNDIPPVLTPSNIDAVYETPNFDFGDLGTNKTLEYLRLSVTPEAKATVSMKVTLNSNDVDTPQPLQYDFPTTSKGGIFGIGTFGTSLFGQGDTAIMKAFLQGSGYTASFKILTENQESPYTINGFYINYAPSTRR